MKESFWARLWMSKAEKEAARQEAARQKQQEDQRKLQAERKERFRKRLQEHIAKVGSARGFDIKEYLREKFDLGGLDLREADLRGANLAYKDMHGANLQGADLREASLCEANLTGVDLKSTRLSGANFSGANLEGATLADANLSIDDVGEKDIKPANFFRVNLKYTNLSGANLSGVSFDFSDLTGANLNRAKLGMVTQRTGDKVHLSHKLHFSEFENTIGFTWQHVKNAAITGKVRFYSGRIEIPGSEDDRLRKATQDKFTNDFFADVDEHIRTNDTSGALSLVERFLEVFDVNFNDRQLAIRVLGYKIDLLRKLNRPDEVHKVEKEREEVIGRTNHLTPYHGSGSTNRDLYSVLNGL